MDMFAWALKTRYARFISPMRSPGCEGVKVFSIGWGGVQTRWTFPQFVDAHRVLNNVVAHVSTSLAGAGLVVRCRFNGAACFPPVPG